MPRRSVRTLLLLGSELGQRNLSCTLTPDGLYANCKCFEIPYGVYFVDINSILNHAVFEKTVAQCGADGSLCQTTNSAPVCQSVNSGTLIPGTNVFSTFSFDCIPTNGIGETSCSQASYAGCMTTPCFKTAQSGIVNCSCPVFDGPYQVGQNDQVCALGDDLVWSASYAPPTSAATETPAAEPTVMTDVLDALLISGPSRTSSDQRNIAASKAGLDHCCNSARPFACAVSSQGCDGGGGFLDRC